MSDLFQELINIRVKRSIGSIVAQATIEEMHQDSLTITEHPVESGANISDHAYRMPARLFLKLGWSNSGYASLGGAISDVVSALTTGSSAGVGGNGYVQTIYKSLLDLQRSRELIKIQTGKRLYDNMLIQAIAVHTDAKSENALFVTMACQEILIVNTQATSIASAENQANAKLTAAPNNVGIKQLKPGSPSPGGSLPLTGL